MDAAAVAGLWEKMVERSGELLRQCQEAVISGGEENESRDSAEKHEKPAAPQNHITAGLFSLQSAVGLPKCHEQPAAGEEKLYACCPAILEVEHAQHEEQAENADDVA